MPGGRAAASGRVLAGGPGVVPVVLRGGGPVALYGVYQPQWRFSAITLTAVFAVYALLLLITLLRFGSVSDYLGRRRVIEDRLFGKVTLTVDASSVR